MTLGKSATKRKSKTLYSPDEFLSKCIYVREGNLADLKLKNGLFMDISGPKLGATLIMYKNGLIFPLCSSLTLRRPQMSLDSRYCQEDMKNLKRE